VWAQSAKCPASRKYIILAIGFTVSELPLSYRARVGAKPCDRNVPEMKTFRGGNNWPGQKDDFPSCLYSNDFCSMETIVARSREAKAGLSLSHGGYSVTEIIIAVLSAMPSSILIYMSVHHNWFLSSRGLITWVLAIAFASTVALIEAL
jgi:hypothetical protein